MFFRRSSEHSNQPTSQIKNEQIDSSDSFVMNEKKVLELHGAELPSNETPPTIAIVKRAMRELSNGHITEQLRSLWRLNQGTDVEMVIVVNNLRIAAVMAEQYKEKDSSKNLSGKIGEFYKKNKWDMDEEEQVFLEELAHGKVDVQRIIESYRENQLTLKILRETEQAIDQVKSHPDQNNQILNTLLQHVSSLARVYLSESQLLALVTEIKNAFTHRSRIVGVDCSSKEKAFTLLDLGQATNQGGIIAVARGAKYLDISDMDQFYEKDSLDKIVELSEQDNPPDVIYRPLELILPEAPEGQNNGNWADIISFYRNNNVSRRVKYWRYNESEEYFHSNPKTSGKVVVSSNAFKRHQYANGAWTEDLTFDESLRVDDTLSFTNTADSRILLSHRSRQESFDGKDFKTTQESIAEATEHSEKVVLSSIGRLMVGYQKLYDVLEDRKFSKESGIDKSEVLNRLEALKRHFEMLENVRLRTNRLLFLGSNGIASKIFPQLSADGPINTATTDLSPRQVSFIEHNPGVIIALQKMHRETPFASPAALNAFLEKTLPELFGPRIPSQKVAVGLSYLTNRDMSQDTTESRTDFIKSLDVTNFSYWMPVFQAFQTLGAEYQELSHQPNLLESDRQLLKIISAVSFGVL